MPRKPYPLEVLLDLRTRRVEDATVELASAIQSRENAVERRQALEAVRARAAAEASTVRDAERDALGQGALRAVDLQRGGAWETVARAEREAMDAKVEHAALDEQGAADQEARARGELVQRKADADVVDKDRSRYLERARKRIVAMEEESASDAWRKR